jgi:alanine dehydrogenase
MIVGILKEPQGENRVSLLPEQVVALIKKMYKLLLKMVHILQVHLTKPMYKLVQQLLAEPKR